MTTQERLREVLDNTLQDFLSDYRNGYERSKEQGLNLEYCTYDTITGFLDELLQLIETEIIGEDEPNPFTENYDFRNPVDEAKKIGRNQLRAEQRTTLRGGSNE